MPVGLEEAPGTLVTGQTLMSQVQGQVHLYPAQRTLLFLAQESDFSLFLTAFLAMPYYYLPFFLVACLLPTWLSTQ